nr:fimbria/pilus outer membrane usher protein [uncultured Enterobacter sp.]
MATSRFFMTLASGAVLAIASQSMAHESVFNPALLEIDHPVDIDINQFNRANALPPGSYTVDIYINGKIFERQQVSFVQETPTADLRPCFVDVKSSLASMGVKVAALPTVADISEEKCIDPALLVQGSVWALNADKLELNVVIPQIYLDLNARDYISPTRWDEGINALMVNYNFSASHTLKSHYDEDETYYLNLQNGVNLGAWRLRNYSTLNGTSGNADYHSISTYIQRNIAALRSQIMLGDTWTASDVFDSTQIRGVRLYTDEDMLPRSMNGFAPVVRGIAKSNATVTIRQSNYIIYQSAVPQGAFEITDLNTANSGGDLDVTIKEEDGSEQHFVQPYASLAILKREGQTDVDLSVGEMRDESGFTPGVFQAQMMRGFAWGLTAYGGIQGADDYTSAAVGIGKDMGTLGAISLDVTHAHSRFNDDDDQKGQSYRILYSKRFEETDTSFRLVGYRYSTEGYYTLNEWASRQNHEGDFWETGNRRSRVEGTWTQAFDQGWGNIYLTLSHQQYWQTNEVERLVQFGYSNNWRQISWNASLSYVDSIQHSTGSHLNDESGDEQVYMLSVSVPLSGWLDRSYVNYSLTQNTHHESSHNVGIGGTLLEGNNLSYNLQQSYASNNDVYSGNAGLAYSGTYGEVEGNYAYSRDSRRLNYGVKGGIVAHSDGVTLSQELGETVALVKAPGAEGLAIENATGVATDWRGYTVKTQLSPYEENRVAIQSDYFSRANVELDNPVINIVPTRGAVVKAEFVTHVGYRVLFSIMMDNGKPAPFGTMATATTASGDVTGIVGDNGDLYLAGIPEKGTFSLRTGEALCVAHYQFEASEAVALIQTPVVCKTEKGISN